MENLHIPLDGGLIHKVAFRMFLHPGAQAEYRRRHDAIWPELIALLKEAGIEDYSIFLDDASGVLFAVLRQPSADPAQFLASAPVMQRWWSYMADLMRTHPDGSPVCEALPCMFHLP
jgi:L-rhamnose mutarotase